MDFNEQSVKIRCWTELWLGISHGVKRRVGDVGPCAEKGAERGGQIEHGHIMFWKFRSLGRLRCEMLAIVRHRSPEGLYE